MNLKILRVAAAIIALIYIAIQTFQWYVFEQFKTPASAAEELQQGNHSLHLVRSSLMLAAMFMLLYVRYVICFLAGIYNRFWANLAFICYFIFFMLEVLLRSTELHRLYRCKLFEVFIEVRRIFKTKRIGYFGNIPVGIAQQCLCLAHDAFMNNCAG